MSGDYSVRKLTECEWLNLYEVEYSRNDRNKDRWYVSSRKEKPVTRAAEPDAVLMVPILKTPNGNRLVVTREFRVPVWDYEYGFPAGLIDAGETPEDAARREMKEETGLDIEKIVHTSMPVYSTAGMSDESNLMVLLECAGTVSNDYLEKGEDIEVVLMDIDDLRNILKSSAKVAAKAWGMFYHFAAAGKIEFSQQAIDTL